MAIGVVSSELAVPMDDCVDCSGLPGTFIHLVQKGNHRLLMRDGDIYAQFVGLSQRLEEFANPVRVYFPGMIGRVHTIVIQGGLLEHGRDGVADGVADNAQCRSQSR